MSMALYMASVSRSLSCGPSSSSGFDPESSMLILREDRRRFEVNDVPRLAAWFIMSLRTITSARYVMSKGSNGF